MLPWALKISKSFFISTTSHKTLTQATPKHNFCIVQEPLEILFYNFCLWWYSKLNRTTFKLSWSQICTSSSQASGDTLSLRWNASNFICQRTHGSSQKKHSTKRRAVCKGRTTLCNCFCRTDYFLTRCSLPSLSSSNFKSLSRQKTDCFINCLLNILENVSYTIAISPPCTQGKILSPAHCQAAYKANNLSEK